jgi:hypothetical protein
MYNKFVYLSLLFPILEKNLNIIYNILISLFT